MLGTGSSHAMQRMYRRTPGTRVCSGRLRLWDKRSVMESIRMRRTCLLDCELNSSLLLHNNPNELCALDSGINFGLLVVVAPLMYLVVRTVPERMPMEIEEQKDLERAKAQVQHAQEQEELEEK